MPTLQGWPSREGCFSAWADIVWLFSAFMPDLPDRAFFGPEETFKITLNDMKLRLSTTAYACSFDIRKIFCRVARPLYLNRLLAITTAAGRSNVLPIISTIAI